MSRMIFDASGKIAGVDGVHVAAESPLLPENGNDSALKRSDSLTFLKEDKEKTVVDIFNEEEYWNLYDNGTALEPLRFSNGKTQEDVVREIVDLVQKGKKVIFLHGACGTGKSAIALNVGRVLGRTSIVVPVKALQKQYEKDYMERKYVLKRDGSRMKIAMISGRENHDSIIKPGISCADLYLPETIKIHERNYSQLVEYYRNNPLLDARGDILMEDIGRILIAPANPYWSPILPADFEIRLLRDARKYSYAGADGRRYVFYHRKEGCSYYDQYLAYVMADVIIFNAAKYMAELRIGRKPATEVDIIDEADDFLDDLFQQESLNLTRLARALEMIVPDHSGVKEKIRKIIELIDVEEQRSRALGIDSKEIYSLRETQIAHLLSLAIGDAALEAEIVIDELNYGNKLLEIAHHFKDIFDDVFVQYRKDEDNLIVTLASVNLSSTFQDLMERSKTLIFMSGTLHSEEVIQKIFRISDYAIVEAECLNPGTIEIIRTGKEFDCKYSHFSSGRYTREDYLSALGACVVKAPLPVLVHVQAFQDLPTDSEQRDLGLYDVMCSEILVSSQKEDVFGKSVELFKQGVVKMLFTTKCSRGVDFPGAICRSVIFTKYPNPNAQDIFWKVLYEKHPAEYWTFYKDKARREFLQRIFRAVRSVDDHVYVLSPDVRVLNAVRDLQFVMQKAVTRA